MEQQVKELKSKLDSLKPGDRKFASSLIQSFESKGSLSPKQAPWIGTLLERAENTSEPVVANVGSMEGLVKIFKRAAEHIKYPKIVLTLASGFPVMLKLAGPRAKTPGSVYVTNGGQFGSPDNRWYGRVSPQGEWEQGSPVPELADVGKLLEAMSSDPAGTAAAYGHLTGNCCFCRRKLEDERSVSVGYGRICAGHYGLPWG